MASQTQHNQPAAAARSLWLDTGFQQPRSDEAGFYSAVNEIGTAIIDGFGLDPDQIEQLRDVRQSRNSMAHQVPNQIRENWAIVLQVLGAPELRGDSQTITQVCTEAVTQLSRLFKQFGLSTRPISEGLGVVSRQLAGTGSHS